MEWIISIIVTLILIWCASSFFVGVNELCERENLDDLPLLLKITFVAEMIFIVICIFAFLVFGVKKIIFG